MAKLVYLPSYVGGQNIWVLPSFPLLLEQLDAAAKFEDQKDVQSTLTKTLLWLVVKQAQETYICADLWCPKLCELV